MNDHNTFHRTASDLLGVTLTPKQIKAFQWYENELRSWNQRYNLTAITDPNEIYIKHDTYSSNVNYYSTGFL